MREWERKFDEEHKRKEEELIRKFYSDTEENKINISEQEKTNNNYEEKN